MIQALAAAAGFVSAAGRAVRTAGAAASALNVGSPKGKDAERAARARQALAGALAGNLADAQYIAGQRLGSATSYGKRIFSEAWSILERENPRLAQQALGVTYSQTDRGDVEYTPTARDAIGNELERLRDRIRAEAGDTAQRIVTGSAAPIAEDIAGEPRGTRSLIPGVSSSTLWIGGAIVLALVVILSFSRRKK